MTIHVSDKLEAELQAFALLSHTSVDEIAEDALSRFILERRDLNEAVKRANADIAAGRVFSQEEVEAQIYEFLDRA